MGLSEWVFLTTYCISIIVQPDIVPFITTYLVCFLKIFCNFSFWSNFKLTEQLQEFKELSFTYYPDPLIATIYHICFIIFWIHRYTNIHTHTIIFPEPFDSMLQIRYSITLEYFNIYYLMARTITKLKNVIFV